MPAIPDFTDLRYLNEVGWFLHREKYGRNHFAASYAEAGVELAVKWACKSLELAPESEKKEAQERLDLHLTRLKLPESGAL